MERPIISLKDIKKSFNVTVLDNLKLDVFNGEFVMVVGVSGSGKSTLFNILSAIDFPDTGSYTCFNQMVTPTLDFSKQRLYEMGYIYQNFNLIGGLSAKKNILLPTIFAKLEESDINTRLKEVVTDFKLNDFIDRDVSVLSGGEQQRVAIARSVFLKPKLLLADEPTGNLDNENSVVVMDSLKTLHLGGTTIIMITHDLSLTKYASRVLLLKGGKLHDYKP